MPICWHSLTPQALVSCNPGIVCMNANKARLVLLQAKAGVPQNQWFLPAGEHTFKEYSTWKLSCMLACLLSHFSRVGLCAAMDCSPPGASVHGILQARILQRVAMPFTRGSSQPRGKSASPALQADSLPTEPWGKPASCLLPLQIQTGL